MPHIPLRRLAVSPVTQIVSLGPRCATAYNLRRFFDFQSAGLFDWWITPAGALETIFANLDTEYLYDPTNLELSYSRNTVIHIPSGALFHHEFPRQWNIPGQPVLESFRDHIDVPKARSRYLIRRLLAMNSPGERILFVREGQPQGEIIELLEPLIPFAEWSIAFIHSPLETPEFGWMCDPLEWNGVLRELGLNLDRRQHKHFEFRDLKHAGLGLEEML
jgi:hypothetical protein